MTTTTVTKTDQRCGVSRDAAAHSDTEMLDVDSSVSHDVMTSADRPSTEICRPLDEQEVDICDTELEDISKIFSQFSKKRNEKFKKHDFLILFLTTNANT